MGQDKVNHISVLEFTINLDIHFIVQEELMLLFFSLVG